MGNEGLCLVGLHRRCNPYPQVAGGKLTQPLSCWAARLRYRSIIQWGRYGLETPNATVSSSLGPALMSPKSRVLL